MVRSMKQPKTKEPCSHRMSACPLTRSDHSTYGVHVLCMGAIDNKSWCQISRQLIMVPRVYHVFSPLLVLSPLHFHVLYLLGLKVESQIRGSGGGEIPTSSLLLAQPARRLSGDEDPWSVLGRNSPRLPGRPTVDWTGCRWEPVGVDGKCGWDGSGWRLTR